jgi:hypothetical protein
LYCAAFTRFRSLSRSPSPSPSASQHSDGGSGPAPGGPYWNAIQRKNRTEQDDYYFERIHALPWSVAITLEQSGGSAVPLMCECFVYSVPIFPTRTAEGEPVPDDEAGEEALATYIVALMLDSEGKPKPVQIPANATLRAKVQVGPGQAVYDARSVTVSAGVVGGGPSVQPATTTSLAAQALGAAFDLTRRGSAVQKPQTTGAAADGKAGADGRVPERGVDRSGGDKAGAPEYDSDSEDLKRGGAGGGKGDDNLCDPAMRQSLTPDKPYVDGNLTRWVFTEVLTD